jgi:hypothetical protein
MGWEATERVGACSAAAVAPGIKLSIVSLSSWLLLALYHDTCFTLADGDRGHIYLDQAGCYGQCMACAACCYRLMHMFYDYSWVGGEQGSVITLLGGPHMVPLLCALLPAFLFLYS